jgi:hypothetical protein
MGLNEQIGRPSEKSNKNTPNGVSFVRGSAGDRARVFAVRGRAALGCDGDVHQIKAWLDLLRATAELPPSGQVVPETEELKARRKENKRLSRRVK